MQVGTFLALWAVAAFVLLKFITFAVSKERQARRCRELGCKPTVAANPGDLSLGISYLRQMLRSSELHRLPNYLVEHVSEISKREGRLVTTMQHVVFGERTFWTCEPRNIQAILATQFKDFELGLRRTGNFHPLLGDGIFASNGKKWEHSRGLLRPQFARGQISDLDLEEKHVQNMMKALPANAADRWTNITNIQTLFFRLTVDSSTEFLFGESIDSQLAAQGYPTNKTLPPECNERTFASAFDLSQWYLARAVRLGKLYWLGHTPAFKKECESVHAFVDYFVQMALDKNLAEAQQKEEKKSSSPSSPSSSSSSKKEKYIFLHALAAETTDPIELRNQLLNILLAGRDTTASLLSWLFLMLARHPSRYITLRRAILGAFGTYDAPKDITYASLKACAPLRHHLAETLRLFPVVPFNSRTAATDTTLPTGGGRDGRAPVFVPAGTEVEYNVYVMQRRKDLWGDDADAFRPERWEGRRAAAAAAGWEYLPFNGGPRVCIGQQFALTEAAYVVVRLLQRFDRIEGERLEVKHGLTLTDCPAGGVLVRLREAARRQGEEAVERGAGKVGGGKALGVLSF
ncbi:hypothetical protein SLS58_010940 [Diplodia intermedia]|uniref:Cytochrome P450 n=1 Tax=Diplodia intermedia TaxID=856260 RepID=A0ABR3T3P9_9PEZI